MHTQSIEKYWQECKQIEMVTLHVFRISKCSNSTESTCALIVVDAGVEFIHTVAVVADANINSLDIANVTRNFHCGLHAKLVDKGGGLYSRGLRRLRLSEFVQISEFFLYLHNRLLSDI